MNGAVIAALITGTATIVSVVITVIAGNRKISTKLEVSQAVTQEKIANLTDEVRSHNNFARRMPVVEEKVCNIERRLDVLEERKAT